MKKTIKEVVDEIQNREYILPTIQRNFVWKPEDIECLFDSILRGYPFGIFLFWKMNEKIRENYRFYEFCEDYIQGEAQTQLNCPLATGCKYGILDGQQRLTSMCVALKGSYTYARSSNSLVKRKFYFNLLNNQEPSDFKFEFKFLSDRELERDRKNYWYLVNNILNTSVWPSVASANKVYQTLKEGIKTNDELLAKFKEQEFDIVEKLAALYNCICYEKLVNITEITSEDENEVLDIFVRLNNQGKPLSRTDFIFSKIVAVWSNAREEIENLQQHDSIKKFNIFNKDMIMRVCLAIANKSTVSKLTISSLDVKTIEIIQRNWDKIKDAIINTAELLNNLGYDSEKISSTNAIIPIVCFLYNGGRWKYRGNLPPDFYDIRKYLSVIKIKLIFSGQTITKLNNILSIIQENNERPFSVLLNNEMFSVTKKDIDNALLSTKGSEAFPILSLLYDKKYDECDFVQDHMHPISKFSRRQTFSDNNVPADKMKEWAKMADTLPNLQILKKDENLYKADKYFEDWVNEVYPTESRKNNYLKETYLSNEIPLGFADFETFYEERKKNIDTKINGII
ncbi:DUF262 domain-containing protein [bacterium]|nr:DUF262 domain-containing protein [bacterium]